MTRIPKQERSVSDLIKREIPEEFVEAYRIAMERTA